MPSSTHPSSTRRYYNGIYSTSICDMFRPSPRSSNNHNKGDACALACCGILLYERNVFVALERMPKPWYQRLLPLILFVTTSIVLITLCVVYSKEEENDTLLLRRITVFFVIFGSILTLKRFQQARLDFRLALAKETFRHQKLDENDSPESYQHNDDTHEYELELDQFLIQHHREIHHGHSLCGCVRVDTVRQQQSDDDDDAVGLEERQELLSPQHYSDFCSKLWDMLACLCCGCCCGCWCQWCGMCAMAQEHRHIQRLYAPRDHPHRWQRDYITLQPWIEYAPGIDELRETETLDFLSHLRAISKLSARLLKIVGFVVLVLFLLTILPSQNLVSTGQFLLFLGVLYQPTIILFFVHWLWNRFDISIDALIKFFASGFVVATSTAIVYEILASIGATILETLVALITVGVVYLLDPDASWLIEKDDDDGSSMPSLNLDPPIAFAIAMSILKAFLNAFMVAALVEELVKYLSFYMIEHPDLDGYDDLSLNDEDDPEDEQVEDTQGVSASQSTILIHNGGRRSQTVRSLVSRGAGITIAMVTTALGFACAENLMYIFVYADPGIASQTSTLAARSLFPVHPLAAALQSIGVCQRDLEGDSSIGVGKILFPALVLHGSFDFALMLLATYQQWNAEDDDDRSSGHSKKHHDDDSNLAPDGSTEESHEAFLVMVELGLSASIVLLGLLYFIKESWAQRRRLERLDRHYQTIV